FAWYPITEAKTGDGGRFTTTATAVESGFWRAEFRGAGDQRATRSAEVASTVTRSAGDVKLSHGLAPASVRKGKTVTHRGTVRYWTGSRWSKVANRTVILRVSGTDYPCMSDTTDSQGKYRITEHAQKSGARTAVFRRQGDYSAGTSPSHEVTVT
ncbi:MAG: hypothetical protein HOY71_27285, partial [Nonomuraea sp.]|nr:hypothetical protein [Nonomuraea sp.]